jgi:DNA-binding IclR family transcriptional regulator
MAPERNSQAVMSNQSGTQAVDRAARLLAEVVHSADPMTFTGLSAATGLAKSTTSRLLLALERNGLVRRDDHGRFLPGEMFVSFAWRGGAEAGLVAVAQPFLERLGKATGETINLGVASNGLVELLAFGAAQLPGGPLERRTDKTVTSETALRAELATVRTRGYAVTDEELEPGLIAVATPIRGYDGAVVAALSVSGPTNRMTRDGVPAIAGYCAEEAAGLSAVLGYRQRGAKQTRKAG